MYVGGWEKAIHEGKIGMSKKNLTPRERGGVILRSQSWPKKAGMAHNESSGDASYDTTLYLMARHYTTRSITIVYLYIV